MEQTAHDPPAKHPSPKQQTVSLFRLLAFADGFDYFLMFVGTIAAFTHASALPVYNLYFGKIVNILGSRDFTPQHQATIVSQHTVALVYVGLVSFAAGWAEVACWMNTGARQAAKLRVKYLEAILKQDIGFFDTDSRTGTIIDSTATDTITVQETISNQMGSYLFYLGACISSFGIGFSLVWKIAFVTVAVVPLIAFSAGVYTNTFTKISLKCQEAYAQAGAIAEQAMAQIRTVYSFVGEKKALDSYKEALKVTLKLGYKGGMAKGLGIGSFWMVFLCSWSLVFWYASTLVLKGETNGGKATTTAFNVLYGGISLGRSLGVLASFGKGKAAATRIFEIIDTEPTINKRGSAAQRTLSEVNGRIELRDVIFSYPSRPDVIIFKDFSLQIPAGKTMALVGGSGSGKSTIVSLIERFYDPVSGQVLLDNVDIRELNLTWLRDQIGLVNQEPILFATTILQNILYGKGDASMKEVELAAKAANAHDYITKLPDGYNTQVGQRGVQLSGGQKQRVAIARAMLRNPKILLLDEATSALDAVSERVVQDALDKLMVGRTTIVIAHRLSTIRNVDTIAVMQGGKVVEQGTHDELMAKGELGKYVTLVKLQDMAEGLGGIRKDKRLEYSPVSARRRSSPWHSNHGTPTHRRLSSRHSNNGTPIWQSPMTLSTSFDTSLNRATDVSKYSNIDGVVDTDTHIIGQGSYYWRLAKLNLPEWPYAILGSLGAILVGTINPLNALFITQIIITFFLNNAHQLQSQVTKFSISLIILGALTPIFFFLQNYYLGIVEENLTNRVREQMFISLLQNEVGWFDRDENNSIALASCLASDAANVRFAIGGCIALIVQNLSIIGTATIIGALACWRMTLIALITLPFIVGESIGEHLYASGFSGDLSTAYARASIITGEAVGNIRIVVAFNADKKVLQLVANELHESEKRSFTRGNMSGFFFGLGQCLKYCSFALTLWYGSTLMKRGECDFGAVIRIFMTFLLAGISMAETFVVATNITKAGNAMETVFEIMDRETIINPDNHEALQVTRLEGKVELRDVHFAYPSRPEVMIFKGLNLRVDAGKSLALVGGSGCGKSSIISLIERFYDPLSGRVLIDSNDIRKLNLRALRKCIGLVQQEPVLFATTIYDNILYGREGATQAEVEKAAKAANAHTFISALPNGYKTQVGERGVQLSGGQKQRVAIARGVLKDPSILLLDEATSALDTETEKLVQDALDRLMRKRTTVIVAHRISTIQNASTIAVLQDGCILEQGSHHSLMAKPNGAYVRLVQLQQHTNSNP